MYMMRASIREWSLYQSLSIWRFACRFCTIFLADKLGNNSFPSPAINALGPSHLISSVLPWFGCFVRKLDSTKKKKKKKNAQAFLSVLNIFLLPLSQNHFIIYLKLWNRHFMLFKAFSLCKFLPIEFVLNMICINRDFRTSVKLTFPKSLYKDCSWKIMIYESLHVIQK